MVNDDDNEEWKKNYDDVIHNKLPIWALLGIVETRLYKYMYIWHHLIEFKRQHTKLHLGSEVQ